jgi:2-polyprenyl-3-methyl-5-hydroxy-6-metoxy-1,4-benzoquinol methylase
MMSKTYPKMEWTAERIANFWDWQSQYPDVYFTYQFGPSIVASLKKYLDGRRTVLDYGCGVGYLMPHLCAIAPEVYGADPSVESIARTNERLAGTRSFKGAYLIDELRAQGKAFDAILSVEVVEHLKDDVLNDVLSDVRGLLAPDGVAIFSTPNNEDLSKNMIICPPTGEIFHRWQHVRNWNRETLPARLRSAGYEVIDVLETNMGIKKVDSVAGLIKSAVKRLLFGAPPKPHLVCVAKRSSGPAA